MTNTELNQRPNDEDKRAYEELAERTQQSIRQIREATGNTLERAINEAKEQMAAAGEFTSEQLENAAGFLRKDLLAMRDNSERAWEFLQRQLDPSRIGSAFIGLASDILSFSGTLLTQFGERTEEYIRYNTGETTGPGTLTCLSCGTELHFTETGKIPPCGNCHHTEFRKSY